MEILEGLYVILKTPVLWTAIALCAVCGVLGTISPKLLESANNLSMKSFDTSWLFSFMDRSVNVDSVLAKHGRIFGLCSLVAAFGLYFQYC